VERREGVRVYLGGEKGRGAGLSEGREGKGVRVYLFVVVVVVVVVGFNRLQHISQELKYATYNSCNLTSF
jgi:hypothetical protein